MSFFCYFFVINYPGGIYKPYHFYWVLKIKKKVNVEHFSTSENYVLKINCGISMTIKSWQSPG